MIFSTKTNFNFKTSKSIPKKTKAWSWSLQTTYIYFILKKLRHHGDITPLLQPIYFQGRTSTVRRKGVSLHSLSLWVLNTQDFLEKGFVLHSPSLWLLNFLVLSRSWTYLELTIIGGIWVWQTLLVKCCILFSRMETMYVVFYVNSSLRL